MIKKFAKLLRLHKIPLIIRLNNKLLQHIHKIPNKDGVICDISLGLKLKNYNPTQGGMCRSIYLYGVFEPQVTNFFINNIKEGMKVLDVGSDSGYFSVIFAKLVGEKGKVMAFEPIDWAYKRTVENIKLNNFNNVVTNHLALSNENGTAFIVNPGEDSRISTNTDTAPKEGKMEIKLIKFDDYIKENPEERIDMIKIDCEGAEMNILQGMTGVISKYQPEFLIEIHRQKIKLFGETESNLYEFMANMGYKAETVNKVDGGFEEYHVHFYK
jgi:FkbM family methyltransferase